MATKLFPAGVVRSEGKSAGETLMSSQLTGRAFNHAGNEDGMFSCLASLAGEVLAIEGLHLGEAGALDPAWAAHCLSHWGDSPTNTESLFRCPES
jgi:hypothetical protein